MIGERISRYRILSKLGAGGMGEVYLAEDTELGRQVAVKVLPEGMASSPERLERFRREARAVAALNHPNIVTIFNVEEAAGRRLLVMEHVDGESLDQLIPKDGLPLNRVFEFAVPLAAALAAAHDKGITHRDLKPANVMVSTEGVVKVLDFGLAKLTGEIAEEVSAEAPTEAASRAASLTGEGAVMGTAPYMSPEQLSGKPVDHRSDVFSLGIVLYEMVLGVRPFQGDSGLELASSILKDDPSSVTDMRQGLPRHLGRIIQHCLEKDPERRFQSAKDIRNELETLEREQASPPSQALESSPIASSEGVGPSVSARRQPGDTQLRVWLGTAALAVLAVVATLWWLSRQPESAPTSPAESPSLQPTFAVVPFRNMGADDAVDYLRLAVPDEITTTLSRAPGLAVRPFSMTAGLAPETLDPLATARDLGVATIITGQYFEEGDRLNLTLEAIGVERQVVVWRKSLVVGAQELISLRQAIAETVERDLLPALGVAPASSEGTLPSNERAYDLYLQSLPESMPPLDAIGLLEQSIELDPEYAPAWSQLSIRVHRHGAYGLGGDEYYERSVAAARRALALDSELIDPAERLILVAVERGQLNEAWDAAEELLVQRPRAASAHFARSYVLRYAGALDRALIDCDTALAADPSDPGLRSCGLANSMAGRFDRALQFLALSPNTPFSSYNTAALRMRQGRPLEAAEQLRHVYEPEPLDQQRFRGPVADALEGQELTPEVVQGMVDGSLERGDSEEQYSRGSILASLGAHEEGLGVIREGIERGYCAYPLMETDPLLAGLRTDERLSAEYADVRAAGKVCHDAFRAHAGL